MIVVPLMPSPRQTASAGPTPPPPCQPPLEDSTADLMGNARRWQQNEHKAWNAVRR